MGPDSLTVGPLTEKIVLFVCVENTFRSVMSEALFNAHAPKGWHAESAGLLPTDAINPLVIELLGEIGIRIESRTPRLVKEEMIERAHRIVTFGCLDRCPIGTEAKSEDWPIPGFTSKTRDELRRIREDLRQRILSLIDRLPEGTDH
jgi:arsenate reductase